MITILFATQRGMRYNPVRQFRKALGLTSGRQWKKFRRMKKDYDRLYFVFRRASNEGEIAVTFV